ncbi:bifunctional NAD(P)/FAD-dependent oxidoreductase/class I SAM-dependent methyltransferase [Kineosporia sp. A_224]|uniref:bifunctional NAD(P)/FAD-dependent oxidoreductase/class I SAM-dependent methyltransferase n=1 Tax=Kineosporia sp. A_224 TaxID=1962180 RepID=UPI000B4AFC5B|nr:bifunctional NAD(P)/FAD-dependent oxidoreductase/class I SAM-dependent methyltransferase [Kineosporia sp. A_224]
MTQHSTDDGTDGSTAAYDVVVVGGGPAGLSGALALVRSRRSVLVVDAGEPRNAPAAGVHNLLGRDGVPPAELLAAGRAEVLGYGGEVVDGRVEAAQRDGDGFVVSLADGGRVRARRLLVATGLVDDLPAVPGLAARWGRDVLHCPYCHGWEARDRRVGVLATGPLAVHQAQLWRQLTPHVLLLTHTTGAPDEATAEALAARQVLPVDGEVVEVLTADDALTGVRLASGEVVDLEVLVVAPTFSARADVLAGLGLAAEPLEVLGHVVATQVPAGADGAPAAPGVWVAGNVASAMAQVVSAAAAGLMAGAAINGDLVTEDTRQAVAAYRHAAATMFEAPAWEERYGASQAIWSGRPNTWLVAETEHLAPGRALDVGCGEGADAVWLAGRGWQVTGVDISATALERAAGHAAAAGPDVTARTTWVRADLRTDPQAAGGGYDLVSAQFMHLPGDVRRALYARLADAVAPGGTLLVVGHHPRDLRTSAHRMHFPAAMFTAEEVAADLDPQAWDVVAAQTRERDALGHEGGVSTVHDAVLVARRRPARPPAG